MKKNFVILAEARTGSSMLCTLLSRQKDIWCYGEILKNGNTVADLKIADEIEMRLVRKNKTEINSNMLEFLGPDKMQWRERRDKHYDQFINVVSEITPASTFGYKIFNKHVSFLPGYYNFLKESNTRVICLSRDNLLLQYISLMTARAKPEIDASKFSSLTFKKGKHIQPELLAINIDYDLFTKFKKKMQKDFIQKLLSIAQFNLPTIFLTYEKLTSDSYMECCKDIFRHLEIDFNTFIDEKHDDGSIAGHIKLNVYKMQEKILNYNDFKAAAEKNNDSQTIEWLQG